MPTLEGPAPNIGRAHSVRDSSSSATLAVIAEEPSRQLLFKMPLLRNAKPRRPRNGRLSAAWDPTLDIFEDDTFAFKNSSNESSICEQRGGLHQGPDSKQSLRRRSNLLKQPAQRVQSEVCHDVKTETTTAKRKRLSTLLGHERRLSDPSILTEIPVPEEMMPANLHHLSKGPRRSFTYVQSDHTTAVTPHILEERNITKSRPRHSNVFVDPSNPNEPRLQKSDEQPRQKVGNKNTLATNPRKAPLRRALRPSQANVVERDIPGVNGGKENFPPGFYSTAAKLEGYGTSHGKTFAHDNLATDQDTINYLPREQIRFTNQQMNLAGRATSEAYSQRPQPASATIATRRKQRHSLIAAPVPPKSLSKRLACQSHNSSLAVSRIPSDSHSRRSSVVAYPILREDLKYPALYEDDWMLHQETAITELFNRLLETTHAGTAKTTENVGNMKLNLVGLYHDPALVLLYRRIQASLSFGALSIPKDTLAQVCRFRDDLQQRQRFLNLWTKTYDLQYLQNAAEVVIGRSVPTLHSKRSASPFQDEGHFSPRARAKGLEEFLRMFLIRNEDNAETLNSTSDINWANKDACDIRSLTRIWSRTVVRSLMIILLLDRGKRENKFTRRLFQPTSPFKSSSSVVQALGSLLLPSIGNINRVLEHLSYQTFHTQCPLAEYKYHIENIAVDLRNGVLLARLVEMLAFQSSGTDGGLSNGFIMLDSENTSTGFTSVSPATQVLSLSQHLKWPSNTRVQKLHNVDISLSHLRKAQDFQDSFGDIKADDVVDGHREKTVRLLWGLFDEWGLDALVDFGLVEQDITRLNKVHAKKIESKHEPLKHVQITSTGNESFEQGTSQMSTRRRYSLLQNWADKVASLRGVKISNLTTSFANGMAYRAIVTEYSACMSFSKDPKSDIAESCSYHTSSLLAVALSSIGCSRAFISLFCKTDTIHCAHTTIALLGLLASRLLPASRLHFAAIVIQRTWRRTRVWPSFRKRMKCAILARECAVVVAARERIVVAAIVLQRSWRRGRCCNHSTSKLGFSDGRLSPPF